jgi:hypothetical protein
VLASCLTVPTFGFGTALTHLLCDAVGEVPKVVPTPHSTTPLGQWQMRPWRAWDCVYPRLTEAAWTVALVTPRLSRRCRSRVRLKLLLLTGECPERAFAEELAAGVM